MLTDHYISSGADLQKPVPGAADPATGGNVRFIFRFQEHVLAEMADGGDGMISSAQMFELKNTFEVVLRSVLLDLNISAVKAWIVDEHYRALSLLASMRYGQQDTLRAESVEEDSIHKRLSVLKREAPTQSRHSVPIAYYVHRMGGEMFVEGISDLEFTGKRILLSLDTPSFSEETDNRDAVIGYVRYCKRILDDWWSYSSFSRTKREFSIESFKKDIKKRSFVKSWNPSQAIAEAKVRFV